MQITNEFNWSIFDFIVAAVLVTVVCLSYGLAARLTSSKVYKVAIGLTLATAFLLVWVNLAVGIIGSEDNPANLMYVGVLVVAIIGSFIARFRPHGMVRAMLATAVAQVLVDVIAFFNFSSFPGPVIIIFTVLWLTSASLFRKAARE